MDSVDFIENLRTLSLNTKSDLTDKINSDSNVSSNKCPCQFEEINCKEEIKIPNRQYQTNVRRRKLFREKKVIFSFRLNDSIDVENREFSNVYHPYNFRGNRRTKKHNGLWSDRKESDLSPNLKLEFDHLKIDESNKSNELKNNTSKRMNLIIGNESVKLRSPTLRFKNLHKSDSSSDDESHLSLSSDVFKDKVK